MLEYTMGTLMSNVPSLRVHQRKAKWARSRVYMGLECVSTGFELVASSSLVGSAAYQ